jgi:hypothetical protein
VRKRAQLLFCLSPDWLGPQAGALTEGKAKVSGMAACWESRAEQLHFVLWELLFLLKKDLRALGDHKSSISQTLI